MKTRTLGLFIGSTQDSYGQSLVQGAYEETTARGARLVVFTSGTIKSYHGFEAQRNVLFNLAGSYSVDALVAAGSLSHSIPPDELSAFFQRYSPLPMVSLAVDVPGVPTVKTDNVPGMKALLDHLLDHHSYGTLAFVGGPRGQQEAELRRRCFLEAHRDRGLEIPPEWMADGDYTRESGRRAAEALLPPGRKPGFRCIVCANDSMALGVADVLEAQGLKIPEDVALTGFDDMEESRFHDPPLTTVRQSAYLQARQGAALALDLLEGRTSEEGGKNLSAQAVIRQSCGCPHRSDACRTDHEQIKGLLVQDLQTALNSPKAARGEFSRYWRTRLKSLPVMTEEDCLQEILAGLHREEKKFTLDLYRAALADLTQEIRRQEAQLRFRSVSRMEIISSSAEELLLSHDLESALEVLARTIPKLGFKAFYLSLFQDPGNPGGRSRLWLALTPEAPQPGCSPGQEFPSATLLPGGVEALDPSVDLVVVEALHSRTQGMGFLVFGATMDNLFLTGSLRSQISSALQGVLLLEDLRARNRDLVQALDDLKHTQDQLVLSEKMAALGNLVAGVAHEINTPLGVALTAASFARGKSRSAMEQLRTGILKKSELEEYLQDLQDSGSLIEANLQRAADLVQSFKQIASDQSTEHRREFRLTEYIKDILLSLAPQWKHRPVEVRVLGPEDLQIDSFPGALAQIVTNLMMNALNHAFDPAVPGLVTVETARSEEGAAIKFMDNGKGIPQENLDHIFEPFFTTRRGTGGTGLGLHIVYNLTVNVLGGRLGCNSTLGQGTVFTLHLPLRAPGLPAPHTVE